MLKNFVFVCLNSDVSDKIRQASFDVQNTLRKTESVLAKARFLLAIKNYTDLNNKLLKFKESFKKTTKRADYTLQVEFPEARNGSVSMSE